MTYNQNAKDDEVPVYVAPQLLSLDEIQVIQGIRPGGGPSGDGDYIVTEPDEPTEPI